MKHFPWLFAVALLFFFFPATIPQVVAQDSNHFEAGAFAEYFRFDDPGPLRNFIGLGGRASFNVSPHAQIEAEMAYDFKRDYTNTYTNGVTSTLVTAQLRTLHGYFGPKFQTRGPLRFFVTAKAGFDNFGVSNSNAPTGFSNSVALTSGATYFALYPGAGFEAFAGPIGVRAEAGDDIFFNNGGHNNLRVSLGPQFRF